MTLLWPPYASTPAPIAWRSPSLSCQDASATKGRGACQCARGGTGEGGERGGRTRSEQQTQTPEKKECGSGEKYWGLRAEDERKGTASARRRVSADLWAPGETNEGRGCCTRDARLPELGLDALEHPSRLREARRARAQGVSLPSSSICLKDVSGASLVALAAVTSSRRAPGKLDVGVGGRGRRSARTVTAHRPSSLLPLNSVSHSGKPRPSVTTTTIWSDPAGGRAKRGAFGLVGGAAGGGGGVAPWAARSGGSWRGEQSAAVSSSSSS